MLPKPSDCGSLACTSSWSRLAGVESTCPTFSTASPLLLAAGVGSCAQHVGASPLTVAIAAQALHGAKS